MQIGLPIAWSHKTKFISQGHWSNCEQSPESVPCKTAWNQAGSLWNAGLVPRACTNAHALTVEALRNADYKGFFQDWNSRFSARSQTEADHYIICVKQGL